VGPTKRGKCEHQRHTYHPSSHHIKKLQGCLHSTIGADLDSRSSKDGLPAVSKEAVASPELLSGLSSISYFGHSALELNRAFLSRFDSLLLIPLSFILVIIGGQKSGTCMELGCD